MAANENKTVDGWILTVETPQGNTYWPEVLARRGLHSKTYKDPLSNTYRFIGNTVGAPRHYRVDGTHGTAPLIDIDLTNPDNIQSFYTLSRLASPAIGYQYTPRDDATLTISILLEGYEGVGVPNGRGEVWYENIGTDLDIYTKPLPYRYGIFKVLKSAAAPTSFVFNGSATNPGALKDALGNTYTMADLQRLKKIEDIQTIEWASAEVLIPARLAWDGNGEPVQVRVTAEYVAKDKSIKLTEQVVLGASPVWPVTVDTDVSYDTTTDDGRVNGYSTDYPTAQTTGAASASAEISLPVGQLLAATYYTVYRCAVFFATGDLPDDASITGASVVLSGFADVSATDFDVTMVAYSGGAPAGTADFGSFGTTSFGTVNTSTYTSGDNTITLNATGRAAIVKNANTPMGIVSSRDISATAPTGNEYVRFDSANGSPAPKIDITYESGTTDKPTADTIAPHLTHATTIGLPSTAQTIAPHFTESASIAAAITTVDTIAPHFSELAQHGPYITAAQVGGVIRLTITR